MISLKYKFVIKRLIRIYAPFICTIIALIHGVLYLLDEINDDFIFNSSAYAGFSILTISYFWATSNRMCKWWYLNLKCLLLIDIFSLLVYYKFIPGVVYFYAGTILASFALIFFLLYRNTVGITKFLRIS